MTTISYPAKGTAGFGIDKWALYFDGEDGILNDYAGTALTLTRINAGEIARYSPGLVRVGGYILEVTANHDLVVSTAAATYYTWVCYDPTLNVADGGGAASADGPCTLGISSGLPSTASGKQYVILDVIIRAASQALTAATVSPRRRSVSTAVEWPSGQVVESVESDYPRGTIRYDRLLNQLMVRTLNAAGTALEWREVGGTAAVPFPMVSGALSAAFAAPQYFFAPGGMIHMRGTVKRTSGGNLSTGSTVTLGTMPAATSNTPSARPVSAQRFAVAARTSALGYAAAAVLVAVDGTVVMENPSVPVVWIDLSNISYRVR